MIGRTRSNAIYSDEHVDPVTKLPVVLHAKACERDDIEEAFDKLLFSRTRGFTALFYLGWVSRYTRKGAGLRRMLAVTRTALLVAYAGDDNKVRQLSRHMDGCVTRCVPIVCLAGLVVFEQEPPLLGLRVAREVSGAASFDFLLAFACDGHLPNVVGILTTCYRLLAGGADLPVERVAGPAPWRDHKPELRLRKPKGWRSESFDSCLPLISWGDMPGAAGRPGELPLSGSLRLRLTQSLPTPQTSDPEENQQVSLSPSHSSKALRSQGTSSRPAHDGGTLGCSSSVFDTESDTSSEPAGSPPNSHAASPNNCPSAQSSPVYRPTLTPKDELSSPEYQLIPSPCRALLFRGGLPDEQRGCSWLAVSGARAAMGNRLYGEYALLSRREPPEDSWAAIAKDMPRTFPEDPGFVLGDRRYEDVFSVLVAFSVTNSDGYCQGFNFITGVLLQYMDAEEAYNMLTHMTQDKRFNRGYYGRGMEVCSWDQAVLTDLVAELMPDLHAKIESMNVTLADMFVKWFLCVFIGSFPPATVVRLWDFYFVHGISFVFSFVLAFVDRYTTELGEAQDLRAIMVLVNDTACNLTDPVPLIHLAMTKYKLTVFDIIDMRQAVAGRLLEEQKETAKRRARLQQKRSGADCGAAAGDAASGGGSTRAVRSKMKHALASLKKSTSSLTDRLKSWSPHTSECDSPTLWSPLSDSASPRLPRGKVTSSRRSVPDILGSDRPISRQPSSSASSRQATCSEQIQEHQSHIISI